MIDLVELGGAIAGGWVLYGETGPVFTHMVSVTRHTMEVGTLAPPLWGFQERETL